MPRTLARCDRPRQRSSRNERQNLGPRKYRRTRSCRPGKRETSALLRILIEAKRVRKKIADTGRLARATLLNLLLYPHRLIDYTVDAIPISTASSCREHTSPCTAGEIQRTRRTTADFAVDSSSRETCSRMISSDWGGKFVGYPGVRFTRDLAGRDCSSAEDHKENVP